MEIIPQLIKNYSIVLYAVCGIACAYFVFTGLVSLRELRRAVFRLERSAVISRIVSAWLKALLCILAAGAIYVISSLAPARGDNSLLPGVTPTAVALLAPTSMPTADIDTAQVKQTELDATQAPEVAIANTSGLTATETVTAALTETILAPAPPSDTPVIDVVSEPTPELSPGPELEATPLSTPTSIPSSTPPDTFPAVVDCADPAAQVTSPTPGERVAGFYAVRGTAIVEIGGYYKLEILEPGAIQGAFLGQGDVSVVNGELLAPYDFSLIGSGPRQLRLLIVRPDSNLSAVCTIPFTIEP